MRVTRAIVEVEETTVYHQVIGKACATASTVAVSLSIPLFVGAQLRARQTLCAPSPYSPAITVGEPQEWPLGPGPFKAGFRLVADLPVSPDISFVNSQSLCNGGTYTWQKPAANKAVIFYPATADGQNTAFAAGGPFPVIVVGSARRMPACVGLGWQVCPNVPPDILEDYRQLSGILSHLARWGFVCITPDLWWLTDDPQPHHWGLVLNDAASYMIAENTRAGSPFQGKVQTMAVSLLGHSTSGAAAVDLATTGSLALNALALLAPAGGADSIVNVAPKPLIVLHGTKDGSSFGDAGQSVNVYAAAAPVKHMVTIGGANHFGFTDSLCIQIDDVATISQADQQTIARAYLTAFFRRYLTNALEVDDYLTGARPVEELGAFTITVDSQT